MKKLSLIAMGTLIFTVLVLYMLTFQVNFHQMAVVTMFGKADASSVINMDGNQSGLHWKWPWPIQQFRLFDTRLRVLEDRLEQQETRDKQVVIMKAFIAWRVTDPLLFQRSLQDESNAMRFIRDRLRTARAEIGNFTFDDLTNVDPEKLRLAEAEEKILERIQADLKDKGYGIAIHTLGIKRILLPDEIKTSVYARMRQTRQRLAQNARSEGEAIARSIRARARGDEQRILAFAERKAQSIRAEGDAAAARYYQIFAENEEFAVFMRKLEALETVLANNSTFLLDTKIEPFGLLEHMGSGKISNP